MGKPRRFKMSTRRNLLLGGGALVVAGAGVAYATYRGMGSLAEYESSVAATRAALGRTPEIGALIRFATLAPSGHNAQPWKFRVAANRVAILPDLSRRTPIVDPDDHHLFVGLGCAGENLSLASAAVGHPGDLGFDDSEGGAVVFAFGEGRAEGSALFEAIPRRGSSRAAYDGKPVSDSDLRALTRAASIPGVDLILITDRPGIDRVRDLVVAGNGAQLSDKAFTRELKSWLRFSPRQAIATGDGLFTVTTGNPALPAWLGPIFFDWAFKTAGENEKYARWIDSSSGIAVFVAQKEDREHWVLAGRACQRFALTATSLGLKHAFINQPVEVAALRPELAKLVGLPGRRPDLVMRFGHGPAVPFSARRPIEAVLA